MNISHLRRRIIPILILSLILTMSLTACKNDKNTNSDATGETSQSPSGSNGSNGSNGSSDNGNTPTGPVTYTVIATNACGTPQSGVLITVYQNVENGRSIVNGTTDEDGSYIFTAPQSSYCIVAIQNNFIPVIQNAEFEEGATTLTVAIGDHPKGCGCITDEETTAEETTAEETSTEETTTAESDTEA